MADEVKMVVVGGVRYRPEDAPKQDKKDEESSEAQHKMRTPRKTAEKKS